MDPGGGSQNETDFDYLILEHQGAVRSYVRSLLPGFNGADDIAQEVLLTAWEKRLEFELGSNFKAWIFRIAHYSVQNQRRKLVRHGWLIFDDEMVAKTDPEWVDGDSTRLEAEAEALQDCLGTMKPEDRELLSIRYESGLSLEEFARKQEISPGTLKARLFRIRSSLRSCIEARLQSEEG